MTLQQIVGIADAAYPDGKVRECLRTGKACGDTLALFLARELKDTYAEETWAGAGGGMRPLTDAEQLGEAARAVGGAVRELEAVRAAFLREIEKNRGGLSR